MSRPHFFNHRGGDVYVFYDGACVSCGWDSFMFVMLMVFVVVSIVIVRRMVAEYRAARRGYDEYGA